MGHCSFPLIYFCRPSCSDWFTGGSDSDGLVTIYLLQISLWQPIQIQTEIDYLRQLKLNTPISSHNCNKVIFLWLWYDCTLFSTLALTPFCSCQVRTFEMQRYQKKTFLRTWLGAWGSKSLSKAAKNILGLYCWEHRCLNICRCIGWGNNFDF